MSYEVRSGDTLSAIARRNGTSVAELQRLNRLDDPDRIRAGQTLRLPGAGAPASPGGADAAPKGSPPTATPEVAPSASAAVGAPGAATAGASAAASASGEPWATTVFRLVDAIGRPIVGLLVRLRSAGGQEALAKTDADGCVVPFRCDAPGERIDIHVERAAHKGGGEKPVGSYTPLPGAQTVRLQSGKQVEKTRTRRHEGPPSEPPRSMKREASGAKIETATREGHPLTCVKCGECPNDDDLMLGVNAEYREHIVAAARRAGVVPQTVAALIGAEARPERKSGKWLTASEAGSGSATGLTQFVDETWVGHALQSGTLLYQTAVERGWLGLDPQGQLRFAKRDGTFVCGRDLPRKLRAMVKNRVAADPNLQDLMDLRRNAKYSIMASMDFAHVNLGVLKQKGYTLSTLNDAQTARVIYLCHHLGAPDAVRFIEKAISSSRAQTLLKSQLRKESEWKPYLETHGDDWVKAHRAWLQTYVRNKIVLSKFACPGRRAQGFKVQEDDAELLAITDKLAAGTA